MKILVVSYSQTGQLDSILEQFLLPFAADQVDHVKIRPREDFPFPWDGGAFFDAMPETVLEEPIALEPLVFQEVCYDLVVLGYQSWFLSPSLPVASALQTEAFQKRLRDTPVVTISGNRNMWLNAQESVKTHIRRAGGKLIANIPLVDRNQNHISVITIVHWLFSGRKDRKWGIFPRPGVSEEDIRFTAAYGQLVKEAVDRGEEGVLQTRILAPGKITVPTDILFIEERAKRLFRIWAKLIRKKGTTPGKRKFLVTAFTYYLLAALFLVAPVLLSVYYLCFRPFTGKQLLRKKEYFCSVESNN